MECLRDYIGIRGCSYTASDSGRYINELPGVEFANIEQLADADQVSISGVWSDVQTRALLRFQTDIIGRLSGFDRRYRLKQITQTVDIGKGIGASSLTSSLANTFRGQTIELNRPGDQFVGSNLQTIYIQTINYYQTVAGSYVVNVKDLDSGDMLWTSTEAMVVGWNLIKVDENFSATRVSITCDASASDQVELSLEGFQLSNPNWQNLGFGYNNNYYWWEWGCSCTSMVRGYSITNGTETFGTNTFGMSTVFSVRCSYDNVVCKNKKYFANAWMYLLGIELMTERMFTSRINRWTTVDLAKAKELRKYFEAVYRGGGYDGAEYEGELNLAINGIELNLNDCCLECDAPIRYQEPRL